MTLKKFLLSVLAVILLIEEWLWDVLTVLGRKLTSLLPLERFELWLKNAPPPVAVVAFAMPLIIVTPINLIAFWMIAHGVIIRGIVLEIFAKLLGTFLVARVFALTKPQLLTFRWFSLLYNTIIKWLHWAHERVAQTEVYRFAQAAKARIKAMKWWKA